MRCKFCGVWRAFDCPIGDKRNAPAACLADQARRRAATEQPNIRGLYVGPGVAALTSVIKQIPDVKRAMGGGGGPNSINAAGSGSPS